MMRVMWILLILVFITFSPGILSQSNKTESNLAVHKDFSSLRDTIYTLKPYFVEVNLATQKGYLYSRTKPVKEFGLSTGTAKLEDGVETQAGLYVIQSKKEKWYSLEFDSTLMLNWMGFNWGIGFHALSGNGYYKYLGKRRSSHGCVRVSRTIAKELFDELDEGTPVLVHDGHSAITIKFGNPGDGFTFLSYVDLKYQLNKKLGEMYAGKYFTTYNPKLLIDFNNVDHDGLPIGDSRKIPVYQITFPVSEYIRSSLPQPRDCMIIPYLPIRSGINLTGLPSRKSTPRSTADMITIDR
jgi:hypothetical protein